MKIIVCVKVINGEINPFDESALECALSLSKDVTVISMGSESTGEVLKPLTRLGAKVILISDKAYAGSDTLATAYILSNAIKKLQYDLIICGRQSIDGDTAQVGPMLATNLGINPVTNVISVNQDMTVKTRMGDYVVNTPSLLTVERGYYLRFPSIFSKVREIEIWDNAYLNCDVTRCGLNGSPTRVLETCKSTSGERKCKFIEFSELIGLIEKLKNENKSITASQSCSSKLKSVWAIGEKAYEKALDIADEPCLIKETDPYKIAELAQNKKPSVILWNADLEGRKNAPVAAALLNTGLCADCTRLDTEDGVLIMYRPARGGDVTAKIKCLTFPQMATVRTESNSADVIVSGGRGVKDSYDKLKEFADTIGAELAASRGLVDTGLSPYEHQIGLTGKMVSPKIYIAVGISGAVQHTCAIENADIVIAINPDKDARIFDYADYGIAKDFENFYNILRK